MLGTNAIAECAVQNHLQFAAMDRVLRHGIARSASACLAPDRLAMAVEKGPLAGFDSGLCHGGVQPEIAQHPHRMWQQIDTHAQRTHFLAGFEHFHRQTQAMQLQCAHQTADTATGDQYSEWRHSSIGNIDAGFHSVRRNLSGRIGQNDSPMAGDKRPS